MFPFGVTVRIESPGPVNRYGERSEGTSRLVQNVGVAPSESEETTTRRDSVTDTQMLYLPYGDTVAMTDLVYLPGDDVPWSVDGNPKSWASPMTGWTPGVVVRLTRTRA